MNPLPRLFTYARPYRGRLVAAVAAMLLYAAAAAGLTTLIKPLTDGVLPTSMAPLSFWGVRMDLRAWDSRSWRSTWPRGWAPTSRAT